MRLIDADDIPYVDLNGDMPASKVRVWVAFKDRIDSMPAIGISTIEERKKGTWIPFDIPWYRCSECGALRENTAFMEHFCPNCGTDMRGSDYER